MRGVAAVVLVAALACMDARAQCQDPASESGRFVVSDLEMIDKKTGLVWLRCSAGAVPGSKCNSSMVLPSQTFEVSSQPLGGPGLPRGDWRLPTIEEWEAITTRGCKYMVKHLDVLFEKAWTRSTASGNQVILAGPNGKRITANRKLAPDDFAQSFFVRAARAEDMAATANTATAPVYAPATAEAFGNSLRPSQATASPAPATAAPQRPAPSGPIGRLPFGLGDSVAAVQAGLQTQMNPDPYESETNKGGSVMRMPDKGMLVFFDPSKSVNIIRLNAPYAQDVLGVRIGDSLETLKGLMGEPTRTFPFAQDTAHLYQRPNFNARYDIDKSGRVKTIFLTQRR